MATAYITPICTGQSDFVGGSQSWNATPSLADALAALDGNFAQSDGFSAFTYALELVIPNTPAVVNAASISNATLFIYCRTSSLNATLKVLDGGDNEVAGSTTSGVLNFVDVDVTSLITAASFTGSTTLRAFFSDLFDGDAYDAVTADVVTLVVEYEPGAGGSGASLLALMEQLDEV